MPEDIMGTSVILLALNIWVFVLFWVFDSVNMIY